MVPKVVSRKLGTSKLPIPGRIFRWCLVSTFLAIGGHTLTDVSSAHGPHGWLYPLDCCYGDGKTGNCQMIPAETVTETPEGFMVVLNPGDHGMVKRSQSFRIPYGKEMRSFDDNYHICLHPRRSSAGCFFAPPRTM